jgi:hypothetical protein
MIGRWMDFLLYEETMERWNGIPITTLHNPM